MWPAPVFSSAALALLIERHAGYPKPLLEKIGHPVIWAGKLIDLLDANLNRPDAERGEGRARGAMALVLMIVAAFVPAVAVASLLGQLPLGWAMEAVIATSLIAQKSLHDHVKDVLNALTVSLADARRAVGKIVGRDPEGLDESGIAKAALESLAENTSDGIVAPVLCYALLGLPGLAVYKMINTADSMIGHKSDRHIHFGWASARLDDLVNLPFSRLTGLLFAAAAHHRFRDIAAVMLRDAPKHQSPNAGWPEAALAAALGIRFGGPRSYGGETVDLPWMGEGRALLTRDDIRRGLRLYGRALWVLFACLVLLAILT